MTFPPSFLIQDLAIDLIKKPKEVDRINVVPTLALALSTSGQAQARQKPPVLQATIFNTKDFYDQLLDIPSRRRCPSYTLLGSKYVPKRVE